MSNIINVEYVHHASHVEVNLSVPLLDQEQCSDKILVVKNPGRFSGILPFFGFFLKFW
jgi:hypothetical protein